MNTTELEQRINELIASKSEATPQDIAAALAVHPQVIRDEATLENLKRVTRFSQVSITVQPTCGSVGFSEFRSDWSCRGSGFGYSNIVEDFRKGFWARCCPKLESGDLRVSVSR